MSEIRCACGKYLIPAQGMAQLEDGVFHAEGMAPFCEHQALRAEVERLALAESAAVQSQIVAQSEAQDLAQQVERLTRERDEAERTAKALHDNWETALRERDEARVERAAFLEDLREAAAVQNDLSAQRDRLAAALRRIEWMPDDSLPGEWCPFCGNARLSGHTGTCVVGDALREVDGAP